MSIAEGNDAAPPSGTTEAPHASVIADFVASAVYSGLEEPLCGLGQIADKVSGSHVESSIEKGFQSIGVAEPEKAPFGSADWHAQQIGSAIGTLLPYLLMRKAVKAGSFGLLGESSIYAGADARALSSASLVGMAGKEALLSGATGFAYDSVLRPADDKASSNWLSQRLYNGLSGAATFAVLGGTSTIIGGAGALIERSSAVPLLNNRFVIGMLRNPVSAGALSAVPAGLISSEIDARGNDQTLTMTDRLKSVYAMSFLGAALGATHYLNAKPASTADATDARSRAPAADGQDAIIKAAAAQAQDVPTRAAEQAQDVPTRAAASDRVAEINRPALTAENNPIALIEQELPSYWNEITKREGYSKIEDRQSRYAVYGEIDSLKKNFAHRLLELWNGTDTQPGIANHTDSELATANMSADKIARLREAFTEGGHNAQLAEMMGFEKPHWSITQEYGVDNNQIGPAKEKFFAYENLDKRMELPKRLDDEAYRGDIHNPSWPIDRFPYQGTPSFPNLFHGTSGTIIDPIIQAKAVLSADQVRANGIKKITGEGGSGYTAYAVSTLKTFNGGLHWGFNSSDHTIAGYPLVVGISGDAIGRGRWGTQQGEVTFPNQLKLDGQEVTHLFVPDREAADVSRRVAAGGISNIQVIGFSDLQPPYKSVVDDRQ